MWSIVIHFLPSQTTRELFDLDTSDFSNSNLKTSFVGINFAPQLLYLIIHILKTVGVCFVLQNTIQIHTVYLFFSRVTKFAKMGKICSIFNLCKSFFAILIVPFRK